MSARVVRTMLLAATALAAAGVARADYVSALQSTPIEAPASVAFQNSSVTPGTTSTSNGVTYNFLDRWTFSLDGSTLVSSITAAINFTDQNGDAVLLGITNLQVNLVSVPQSGAPLVSWLTVSAPVDGLQQDVALIPTSPLGAGDYALDVRGVVTQPGAYSGSLIAQPVQPVPLPPSAALFASALMAIGFSASRLRRR